MNHIIEIRQNKKRAALLLSFILIALIALVYSFYSGQLENSVMVKVISIIVTASVIYELYSLLIKYLKNEPVLILSKSEITINEKRKPESFLWQQVIDWKIEEDENTYFLMIQTQDTKKMVNISLLDKSPEEIEVLMNEFKKDLIIS